MEYRLFKIFIFITLTVKNYFTFADSAGGLIWSRNHENFIPINNFSTFKTERQVFLQKSRELETHNFQAEILIVAYYEEENIVDFLDNDTRLGGICGHLWTMMSEYLNFTMKLVKVPAVSIGKQLRNGSYTGLIGMLQRNEIHIIPRAGYYSSESLIMDYTLPISETSYRLFVRPEWAFASSWMLYMFSRQVWCSILLLFVTLSVLGYTIQRISIRVSSDKKVHHTLHDHLFYTYATFCCQGDIPDSLYHRIKILGLSKKILAWLILINLSTHLISYMTNRKVQPPFNGLQTLINSTTYDLIVFNGSLVYDKFKTMARNLTLKPQDNVRFRYAKTPARMYERICWSKRKYAIFDSEDRQRIYGRLKCELVPSGVPYFSTWVAAAVPKNFKYKRTLDMGILKMNECGLTDGLKERFMAKSIVTSEANDAMSVDFKQVMILFIMLFMGMIVSIVVFILENAIFFYYYDRRKTRRRNIFRSRAKIRF